MTTRNRPRYRKLRIGCISATLLVVAAVIGGVVDTAVGGDEGPSDRPVTVTNASGAEYLDNFNPFLAGGSTPPVPGFVYEPLYLFNSARAGDTHPWLATAYRWTDHGQSLTFDLRHNVRWSDGKALTSADVAYTFELELKHAALNLYGIPYKGVRTEGPYRVTVTFTRRAYADLLYVAGRTYIVPRHIWRHVSEPSTYQDPHPVGSGPYELVKYSPSSILFRANPHYYFRGLPKVREYRFLAQTSNTANEAAIIDGQVDWGVGYLANAQKLYVNAKKSNVLQTVNTGTATLVTNDVRGPTASLVVRRAISEAINRPAIASVVYQDYYGPGNAANLPLPLFRAYAAPVARRKMDYSPSKARALLRGAGYTLGRHGIFEKDGKPLSVTVLVAATYSDFLSDLQIIQANLRAVGIGMTINARSPTEVQSEVTTGQFEITLSPVTAVPSLYSFYDSQYDSHLTAPIGKAATGDYGRYRSAEVDSLLTGVERTPNANMARPLLAKLQGVIARDLPAIPVLSKDGYVEFSNDRLTGYPTHANSYASAMSSAEPDAGWVAARLRYAK